LKLYWTIYISRKSAHKHFGGKSETSGEKGGYILSIVANTFDPFYLINTRKRKTVTKEMRKDWRLRTSFDDAKGQHFSSVCFSQYKLLMHLLGLCGQILFFLSMSAFVQNILDKMWNFSSAILFFVLLIQAVHISCQHCQQTRFTGLHLFSCLWLRTTNMLQHHSRAEQWMFILLHTHTT
jgi:hypothetical protein